MGKHLLMENKDFHVAVHLMKVSLRVREVNP